MASIEIAIMVNEAGYRGNASTPLTTPGGFWGSYTTQQQADEACTLTNEFISPIPFNQP
jgi:hypothetical protein